jgi:hypothetical protein
MNDQRVKDLVLYAWVGEDELGSGEVGLKQAMVPAGCIPIVATKRAKVDQSLIVRQLQRQSNNWGKTIRLCRFTFAEELLTLKPEALPKKEEG